MTPPLEPLTLQDYEIQKLEALINATVPACMSTQEKHQDKIGLWMLKHGDALLAEVRRLRAHNETLVAANLNAARLEAEAQREARELREERDLWKRLHGAGVRKDIERWEAEEALARGEGEDPGHGR